MADGPDESNERVRYVAGLDLGRPGEFTALAVLEKHYRVNKRWFENEATYAVRHLERFAPGTAYGQVIESVRGVFAEPPMKGGTLVVDQTAVGRAVFELIRDAKTGASAHGLTVTAGHAAMADERGGWLVPKKDLAGVLQVLLQERRMKVAPALEHAQTLVAEMQQFQLKTVPLDPSALEWRERPHDDLVLAVGIAAWQAEQQAPFFVAVIEGRSCSRRGGGGRGAEPATRICPDSPAPSRSSGVGPDERRVGTPRGRLRCAGRDSPRPTHANLRDSAGPGRR